MPDRSLHLSESFCISSGTVTLDLVHAKVLLILWRKTGEYMLPKGRKDIGETLEQAALRETLEETGHNVKLLPLSIKTLATVPASKDRGEEVGSATEPVAVQQRTTKEGILKIIFWFAASGNSTEDQEERIYQEDEEFDTKWVSVRDVAQVLSWEDDRKITEEVLRAARSEGLLAFA